MSLRVPIAIIATSGDAPLDLAHTLRNQGKEPLIFSLEDITTADFHEFEVITVSIGAIGKMISEMKKRQCNQLVFSGYLKRPSLPMIKPDIHGLKLLAKIMSKGDDQAMKIIKDAFVKEDIEIIDPAHIIPESFAHEGVMSGNKPDDTVFASIRLGARMLHAASDFDIGQSCIVQGERILAVEGAEGTDALIKRTAMFIDSDLDLAVFVKMMKTHQDPSLDPPGFGLDTIKECVEANIKVIALEIGRVMMFKKSDVIAEAERQGITIYGFNASDVTGHG